MPADSERAWDDHVLHLEQQNDTLREERDVARAAARDWETRHNQLADAIRALDEGEPATDCVYAFYQAIALLEQFDVDTGHTGDNT